MPDPIVTASSSGAASATQATPTTSADVANANALNQAISQVRQMASANTTAIIGKLNSIASAIPASLIGGTTGTADSHVLLSKGTTGFALKASSSITQGASNELQVSNTTAGSGTEVLRLRPTDFATGKPYLVFKTGTAANDWQILLWDGTNSNGTIDVFCNVMNQFTGLSQSPSGHFNVKSSDNHLIRLLPSNVGGGYNNLVQNGDECLIYSSSNGADTGNLVFGPWSSLTNGAGFRMNSTGTTSFATQYGFVETVLTDAATIAWDMNANQTTFLTLGGNRTMGTPTNMQSGFKYVLVVQQDGTGNRTLTFPDPPFKFVSGSPPALSTAANAVDIFVFYAVNSVNFMANTGFHKGFA